MGSTNNVGTVGYYFFFRCARQMLSFPFIVFCSPCNRHFGVYDDLLTN